MSRPTNSKNAQILAALRDAVILRTEVGGRLRGRVCSLCGCRWKGNAEKHTSVCLLAVKPGKVVRR